MNRSFNTEILALIGAVEQKADTAFDLAQQHCRKNTVEQKRLLKAYAMLRDAADEIRMAGAGM